ncbi:ABC transporter permease [Wenxinia marina]|uniref:Putative ABC-type transport system involved in lysophospholipase L1 biosynthesis n=1 Tax=Wenxinia marina DSM 24838 TaxID=1123501 RepID=A0A0D0QDP7_9RHOB|nr:FtsX-like permease family protein [Wenxinia marina]KIQ70472.1 putative ABC-type transport system involved in lysophospholipase L1 biosynthesis [Wenxinia marina DSM 24838]GGL52856.1 drug:proton antiporter [Wenxinia marina]
MTPPLPLRLAARDLRGGLAGFRIFLLCLALGVAAIAAVGTVRSAIGAGLAREGATLLGGDAEITFTYRFATDDERAWMEDVATRVSETVEFRSLATVGEDRALTEVKAVDAAYPLLGALELDPRLPLDEALADGGAVMERVLADRLGLTPGETFRLGTRDLTLTAILDRYPDNAAGGFGLAPKTILRRASLDGSGLITEGTLFDTAYRLDLPPEADLGALEEEAEARFEGSGLRWRDARRGAGGMEAFVDRLGSFLILIGLSGLAVGGVGVSSAVRAYIAGKTGAIATLKTLGATGRTILLTYSAEIAALTLLGIVAGLILGAGIPLALAPLIEARLPIPAEFRLYPAPLAEAALYGALAAAIFTLWPLSRTLDIRAAALFRDAPGAKTTWPRWPWALATLVLIAILLGAASLLTGTVRLTLWTAGGIAGALALLALAAIVARLLARLGTRAARGRPALRLALGAIGRGDEAVPVVLSLGLGLAVLAAVGQIDGNLRRAIQGELPERAPSYFFVDIQPDQIDGFRARLDDDPAVSNVDAAPMLRGIISTINGRPASEVTDHWVVQGDRGLTYSAEPPEGTRSLTGEWWPADYDGPPLISFSAAEAEEIGLQIGDTIGVNVLGREITGTIANFRDVDFQSAGIAFVMSMNPSALQGAPHTWIATVYAEEEAETAILRDLADAYPNITAIRIRDVVDEVARLVGGIASATRWGAAATLLTGFMVLIGAALAGERVRTYESAVLKTLGATRGRILLSFALRAALLGLAAGTVALAAGIAGGWAVSVFVMESDFQVVWPNALAIVAGGVLASLAAGLLFALRPLAARPAGVLRARE